VFPPKSLRCPGDVAWSARIDTVVSDHAPVGEAVVGADDRIMLTDDKSVDRSRQKRNQQHEVKVCGSSMFISLEGGSD